MANKLSTIEGIGPKLEEKLKEAGVGSVEKLLEHGKSKKGRKDLASASGIDEGRILKFVNHADLMRIKGIGGEYAELLEASGVDTVPALARRNANNLAAKMGEVNGDKSLTRTVPSAQVVAKWVDEAKSLDRMVEY